MGQVEKKGKKVISGDEPCKTVYHVEDRSRGQAGRSVSP